MDDELMLELEKTMDMHDEDKCKSSVTKLSRYILAIPSASQRYMPIITKFIKYAYEKLPASSLPMQLTKKFSIPIVRKRKISFGGVEVCRIGNDIYLSEEGKAQKRREESTVNIFNTNLEKKFLPRFSLVEGKPFNTVTVPLINMNFENNILFSPAKSNFKIERLGLDIKDIIKNPNIITDVLRSKNLHSI